MKLALEYAWLFYRPWFIAIAFFWLVTPVALCQGGDPAWLLLFAVIVYGAGVFLISMAELHRRGLAVDFMHAMALYVNHNVKQFGPSRDDLRGAHRFAKRFPWAIRGYHLKMAMGSLIVINDIDHRLSVNLHDWVKADAALVRKMRAHRVAQ